MDDEEEDVESGFDETDDDRETEIWSEVNEYHHEAELTTSTSLNSQSTSLNSSSSSSVRKPLLKLRTGVDASSSILSIDIDCFYAQAETIRRPHLKGKPVGVRQKNCVITSNYEARAKGVKKGDSIAEVKRKCPSITICNGENLNYYRVLSYSLFALTSRFCDGAPVERLGMDEVFIDVTKLVEKRLPLHTNDSNIVGIEYGIPLQYRELDASASACLRRLSVASQICQDLRSAIHSEIGLHVSAGVSTSKLLSKMVASKNKPAFQTVFLPLEQNMQLLLPPTLPAKRVSWVGRALSKRLKAKRVETIADVLNISRSSPLLDNNGGPCIHDLITGKAKQPIVQSVRPKTVSVEDSFFPKCLTTFVDVRQKLSLLAIEVMVKLKQDDNWFGALNTTAHCVVTTRIAGDEYTKRQSKSSKVDFPLSSKEIPSGVPVCAGDLTEADSTTAKKLATLAASTFRNLHPTDDNLRILILNLGIKLNAHEVLSTRESIAPFVVQSPSSTADDNEHPEVDAATFSKLENEVTMAEASDRRHRNDLFTPSEASSRPSVQYFSTSRLSFIGSWKARYRVFMRKFRINPPSDPGFQEACASIPKTCISRKFLHIDVDAFFYSIATRDSPELFEIPVAVASGTADSSEVCSSNYPARRFGVKNGIFLKSARQLCPDLKIIRTTPELFYELAEASKRIHSLLLQITSKFRTVSCDEMYLQVEGSRNNPAYNCVDLANAIRKWIYETIGCNVSIGIGASLIAARYATTKAKPPGPGVYIVDATEIKSMLSSEPTRALNGIGRKSFKKLEELGVKTCEDLVKIPTSLLQQHFGQERGASLKKMAIGEDPNPAELDCWAIVDQHPNSLQHDMNFRVRVKTVDELEGLLNDIVGNLVERLDEEGLEARSVGTRLSIRVPGAPPPPKVGGCGHCSHWSKSISFPRPIHTKEDIVGACIRAAKQSTAPLTEIRGVGVALTKLSERYEGGNVEPSASSINEAFNKQKRRPSTQRQFSLQAQDVDPAVMAELPEDIRREIQESLMSSPKRKKPKTVNRIDDFFNVKS